MVEIRPLSAPPAPAPIEPERPASPPEVQARARDASAPLDPAVTVDISPEAKRTADDAAPAEAETARSEARYRRDADSQQMVFQVVDPSSGTVLDQLPSEAALRAKTYARETQAAQTAILGTTVARTA
jgi:flagellar protein FlaG